MPNSKDKAKTTAEAKAQPSCFVIMPISDVEPYSPGHFRRVYDHLISPACEQAGFIPVLASDVKETNMIVLDILERLYNAEMVLCDLSARNPNVLYELGFRQAFNRPVTLIKDDISERIFDISGLRDITYDYSLRIDAAQIAISENAERMQATHLAFLEGNGGVNSLVQLLSIAPADVPPRTELSQDTQVLLNAISGITDRIARLERPSAHQNRKLEDSEISASGIRRYTVRFDGPREAIDLAIAELRSVFNKFATFSDVSSVADNTFDLDMQVDRTIPSRLVIEDVRAMSRRFGITAKITTL
ncbi:MAG TPA: hypothetical protein VFJ16_16765 [Longimicrobium sp.]|nr:hypothetical protein [Longimicrobium sp.]